MDRATISLLLTSRGSFRVATTVPTIFARSIRGPEFQSSKVPGFGVHVNAGTLEPWNAGTLETSLCLGGRGLSDRQRILEICVGTRNDVHRHELADAARRGGTGIRRSLDRCDVAADDCRHVAGADLLPADQGDLRRFN